MKTLHTISLLAIAGMLVVISIQIRGLKPFTMGDEQRLIKSGSANAWKEFENHVPIVEVRNMPTGPTEVIVQGSVEVRTDYKSPLDVKMER